jgi:microsomal dipeptidase-like Zn-dependent dipeptidase
VGIGSDFDGVGIVCQQIKDEHVSNLIAELLKRGYLKRNRKFVTAMPGVWNKVLR